MMRPLTKGIAITVCHLLLLASLAAKYEYDRATRPRLWVKVENRDPNLPVRGRYLALSVAVDTSGVFQDRPLKTRVRQPGFPASTPDDMYEYVYDSQRVHLEVRNQKLAAVKDDHGSIRAYYSRNGKGIVSTGISDLSAFYLPESAPDPSRIKSGEELWAEVTVPKQGPPRPIQLGVRRADGTITPLVVR